MRSTRSRISVVAGLVAVLLSVLLLHLWFLMVADHEVWARRSHENRWAFRSVPSRRGAILDRTGRVLAYDQPTMQVSLLYLRFRLRHPVGAAVHGATTWARLQGGGDLVTYGYLDGALGPDAAVRDLLAIPVRVLRPGALDKQVAGELAFAATTVLAVCGNVPRKVASTALRTAAQRGGDVTIGDVLTGVPVVSLLAYHQRILASLRRFEHDLMAERRAHRGQHQAPSPDEQPLLFRRLEQLRRASLAEESVLVSGQRDGAVGTPEEPRWGDKKETIAWPFADDVSFALAAGLRVGQIQHPGLEVAPSVQRIVVEPDGTAMRALLGSVAGIDWSMPDRKWLDRYVQRELPEDWLDDVVPAGAGVTAAEREKLQQNVRAGFQRETRRNERRGTIGLEQGLDDALTGRLGLRLVERDVTAREQTLWSNLRVEAGVDVRISIDLELQRLAEQLVLRTREATRALHRDESDQDRVEVALAVIDARSGDVLALAGAPVTGNAPRQVPGVVWHGNGALGSVVKPFVMIEQLQAEELGRPCLPLGSLQPCSGSYDYGGKTLGCGGHAHWEEGRDPVAAIAKSCNSFFYQCGVGLGADGVARALQRFGLQAPDANSPFSPCWQPTIAGLRWYAPQKNDQEVLPKRAIGYGSSASPLAVARAYAALATGALPTLGLRFGEARPRVLLDGVQAELEVARQGLDACVQTGTAHKVTELGAFHVMGKTGTAEVGAKDDENNAWFAGFLPWSGGDGVQLCFCSVIYWAPHGMHGGDDAARLVADLLSAVSANPELKARYITPEGGR